MSGLDALILGLIQGVTEFLPISSSGHLILAGKLLGITQMPLAFELVTHLATLLAVLVALRKPVFALVKKPFQKKTALLLVATVPTVVIFFVFRSVFALAFDGRYLIYCFGATAVLIFLSGLVKPKTTKPLPTFLDAALIGIAQGAAGFPGISRSGATICAGRLMGTEKTQAAEFSFLLSVPIIIGSAVFEFAFGEPSAAVTALPLVIGFFTSFLTGLLGVLFMLKFVSKRGMTGFSVYLMILTVFLTVDKFFLHVF